MDFDEKERTTAADIEEKLELVECYLRAGWVEAVERHINDVEEYGIDFEQLVNDAPGLDDPRR